MAYKRCYERYSECRPKWEYYLRDMDKRNEERSKSAIRGAADAHAGWFKYNASRIFGNKIIGLATPETSDKTGVKRFYDENGIRVVERGSRTLCFTPLFTSGGNNES